MNDSTTTPEQTQAQDDRFSVMLPSDLQPAIRDVMSKYGYTTLSNTIRNAVRVGCRLALDDPNRFIDLLNGDG